MNGTVVWAKGLCWQKSLAVEVRFISLPRTDHPLLFQPSAMKMSEDPQLQQPFLYITIYNHV